MCFASRAFIRDTIQFQSTSKLTFQAKMSFFFNPFTNDARTFLSRVISIVDLSNLPLPSMKETQAAPTQDNRRNEIQRAFVEFFKDVQNMRFLNEVRECNVDRILNDIYNQNDLTTQTVEERRISKASMYDAQRQLRSLFVAPLIQKAVTLQLIETSTGTPSPSWVPIVCDSNGSVALIAANDVLSHYFNEARQELSSIWDEFQTIEISRQSSLIMFYIVLREAWLRRPKGFKHFAMRVCSLAVNEGIWYCLGGGSTLATNLRENIVDAFMKSKRPEEETGHILDDGDFPDLHLVAANNAVPNDQPAGDIVNHLCTLEGPSYYPYFNFTVNPTKELNPY